MAELEDEIEESAKAPKVIRGDQGSTEEHPLPDQIAADKYLAGKRARSSRYRGLDFIQIVPPGTE